MASETAAKVEKVFKEMYINNFIDEKTKELLLLKQNLPDRLCKRWCARMIKGKRDLTLSCNIVSNS